jgi:hypothetical protein
MDAYVSEHTFCVNRRGTAPISWTRLEWSLITFTPFRLRLRFAFLGGIRERTRKPLVDSARPKALHRSRLPAKVRPLQLLRFAFDFALLPDEGLDAPVRALYLLFCTPVAACEARRLVTAEARTERGGLELQNLLVRLQLPEPTEHVVNLGIAPLWLRQRGLLREPG